MSHDKNIASRVFDFLVTRPVPRCCWSIKVRLSGDAVGRLHDGGAGAEHGRSDSGDIQRSSGRLRLPHGECFSIA